jgi:hypothetical protein
MDYFLLHNFPYSHSLNISIEFLNKFLVTTIIPNLDPWMNQQSEEHMVAANTINKFDSFFPPRNLCREVILCLSKLDYDIAVLMITTVNRQYIPIY